METSVWEKASNFWRGRVMYQTGLSTLLLPLPHPQKNHAKKLKQTKVYLAENSRFQL